MGILLCSPAGNDIIYDDKLVEQGRNFSNKLWNAARLIKGWEITDVINEDNQAAIHWFASKLNAAIAYIDKHFDDFRISDALMHLYSFIWDDFCSWYLEYIKPDYGEPLDRYTYEATIGFFETALRLLHPFMPFITEEIFHILRERNIDIIISPWPTAENTNENDLTRGEIAKNIISNIRDIRSKNNISIKEPLNLYVETGNWKNYESFYPLIKKLGNLDLFEPTTAEIKNALTFISITDKFYLVINTIIDVELERKKLLGQLEYQKGFLISIEKKLNNYRFVSGAPTSVVETERKKKTDALEKIKMLENSLRSLN
jgi:valyl-tRNA synthetase